MPDALPNDGARCFLGQHAPSQDAAIEGGPIVGNEGGDLNAGEALEGVADPAQALE